MSPDLDRRSFLKLVGGGIVVLVHAGPRLLAQGQGYPKDLNAYLHVHEDGRVLGQHDGTINYTIGQRKGIGVATGEPLYVVHIDSASRRVIVGPREALATHRLGDAPRDLRAHEPVAAHVGEKARRRELPARPPRTSGLVPCRCPNRSCTPTPGRSPPSVGE